MKTYEYRGFDSAGSTCRGLVEALSVKSAREKLVSDGVLAEKIVLTGASAKFPVAQRAATYRQLSALLGAGLPMEKAFDLLIKSPEMRNVQLILAGVRDRVREGSSLSAAFTDVSESITSFETAIMEAAEQSATVDVMLERLADFIEEQEKLKAGVLSALIYPAIVLSLAVMLAVAVLTFLVPWYSGKLAEYNMPIPATISTMAFVGSIVGKCIIPVVMLVGFGVWYYRRRYAGDEKFRARVDQRMFGWPVIGKGYVMLVNLRFARTLSILLTGGVSLIDGLVLSGRATGSSWVSSLADNEAESVRHGSSLAEAVRRIPPLADSLAGWIQTGEASGELEQLMNKAGIKHQDAWNRYTSRCLTLLEPLLIIFVAVFVLALILPVLLSVINLSGMVSL